MSAPCHEGHDGQEDHGQVEDGEPDDLAPRDGGDHEGRDVHDREEQGDEEELDPRANLVQRLVEYKRFKEMSLQMKNLEEALRIIKFVDDSTAMWYINHGISEQGYEAINALSNKIGEIYFHDSYGKYDGSGSILNPTLDISAGFVEMKFRSYIIKTNTIHLF